MSKPTSQRWATLPENSYRMPAEWEPHQGTWMSWPHNADSWPGKIETAWPPVAAMIAALSRTEPVHLNVNSLEMERQARRFLQQAGAKEVHFHHFPTNDAWCRDHGAIFVTRTESADPALPPLAALDWKYNAWGGKYPHDLDNQIPRQMAEHLGCPWTSPGIVLEGGSIDVNGQGLLLTTEACLLNPNRNPHLSREEIEEFLCRYLGVQTVLWLGEGIVGDDTDGHIDDLTRFVAADTLVTVFESDETDENFAPLQDNLRRLESICDAHDLELLALPMPPAVIYEDQRLPASYANFYIGNEIVLLPGYHPETDAQAAELLGHCFPGREIVTIDCTDLIWGLGAFHCLTQQIPRG